MNILLVTGDSAWRNNTRNVLSANGFNILYSMNGRDGLKSLKMQEVDCVITDLKMPFMDGLEFYKETRKIRKLQNIPFIFISPTTDQKTVSSLGGITNCALFNKQTSVIELIKTIKHFSDSGGRPDVVSPSAPEIPAATEPSVEQHDGTSITENGIAINHLDAALLMVDDDDTFRTILGATLHDEGFNNITAAVDGSDAIELLKKQHFDLILLDIYMPTVSGFEVLKFVKETNPRTKVIMITAYKDLKIAVEAKQLGAADFVAKPFIRADLMETIRRILAQQVPGRLPSKT